MISSIELNIFKIFVARCESKYGKHGVREILITLLFKARAITCDVLFI